MPEIFAGQENRDVIEDYILCMIVPVRRMPSFRCSHLVYRDPALVQSQNCRFFLGADTAYRSAFEKDFHIHPALLRTDQSGRDIGA